MSKRPRKQPVLELGPLPIDTINCTMGTELEPGDVVFSSAAQVHAARRHPTEYSQCLPHLAKVICNPLYIGDDHKNPGKIETQLVQWYTLPPRFIVYLGDNVLMPL